MLEQAPAAGSPVDDATRARLVVSALSRVEVPDLVGSMLEEAKRSLEAVGLTLVVGANEESDAPPGSVLRQAPEAGQRVEQGTSVIVTIAVEASARSARPRRARAPGGEGGERARRRRAGDVGRGRPAVAGRGARDGRRTEAPRRRARSRWDCRRGDPRERRRDDRGARRPASLGRGGDQDPRTGSPSCSECPD